MISEMGRRGVGVLHEEILWLWRGTFNLVREVPARKTKGRGGGSSEGKWNGRLPEKHNQSAFEGGGQRRERLQMAGEQSGRRLRARKDGKKENKRKLHPQSRRLKGHDPFTGKSMEHLVLAEND